jgi:ribonucleoside-diphosphate reductase beta chain
MHCNFGIDLINTIKMENPWLWTPGVREEISGLMRKGVELEYSYAENTMLSGCAGLERAAMFSRSICGSSRICRCQQIGWESAVCES